MNKFFNFTSGRPKNIPIKETIKPFIFVPQLIISIVLIVVGCLNRNVFYGLMGMFFSWQMGWGMSIERFNKSEES